MDTNQPTANPTYVQTRPSRGVFGSGIPSTIAFAIGVLLFLLPFSEIKCGGQTLMSKSGLDYALGNNWKVIGGLGGKDLGGDTDIAGKANDKKEGNTRYYILGALGLGVLGLLFSFMGRKGASGGIVTGILAAAALIMFMIDAKKWFNDGLAKEAADKGKEGADSLGMGNMNALQFSFSPWFYVAVVAFVAGAIFCFQRMRAGARQ